MFMGMSKNSCGLRVSFFIDLKVASKKLHQNRLFHTTVRSTINIKWVKRLFCKVLSKPFNRISPSLPNTNDPLKKKLTNRFTTQINCQASS